MDRASGGSDMSHWIRNDIPDFQGATPMILSVCYLIEMFFQKGKMCSDLLVYPSNSFFELFWFKMLRYDKLLNLFVKLFVPYV